MSNLSNRALLVLAAYDYESLHVTLQSLEHTIDPTEKVVVVLNGKKSLPSEKTERVARIWASHNPEYRFVVRPLCSGSAAYFAISEILRHYEPLQNVQEICKIDDDLIPVKTGWLPELAAAYQTLSKNRNIGFVTGLINNNCWGFAELVHLFGKEKEYAQMFNYTSLAGDHGERKVAPKKIDVGVGGTVWQYPYLAWWIHQWTTRAIPDFIEKTKGLSLKQIPDDVHYSIGCIYFDKDYWLSTNDAKYKSSFDEYVLHRYCQDDKKEKWAVMNQPMIHLFYRTQRQANQSVIKNLKPVLTQHFNDARFLSIEPISPDDSAVLIEETLADVKQKMSYLHHKVSSFSFMKKWREKREKKKLLHG